MTLARERTLARLKAKHEKRKAEAAVAHIASATAAARGRLTAPAQNAVVQLVKFQFIPNRVVVRKGASVTWSVLPASLFASEDPPHQIVLVGNGFKSSPELHIGDSFTMTFNEIGEFEFYCSNYAFMSGIVQVVDGQPDKPSQTELETLLQELESEERHRKAGLKNTTIQSSALVHVNTAKKKKNGKANNKRKKPALPHNDEEDSDLQSDGAEIESHHSEAKHDSALDEVSSQATECSDTSSKQSKGEAVGERIGEMPEDSPVPEFLHLEPQRQSEQEDGWIDILPKRNKRNKQKKTEEALKKVQSNDKTEAKSQRFADAREDSALKPARRQKQRKNKQKRQQRERTTQQDSLVSSSSNQQPVREKEIVKDQHEHENEQVEEAGESQPKQPSFDLSLACGFLRRRWEQAKHR